MTIIKAQARTSENQNGKMQAQSLSVSGNVKVLTKMSKCKNQPSKNKFLLSASKHGVIGLQIISSSLTYEYIIEESTVVHHKLTVYYIMPLSRKKRLKA